MHSQLFMTLCLDAEESRGSLKDLAEGEPEMIEKERANEDDAKPQHRIEDHTTVLAIPEATTEVQARRLVGVLTGEARYLSSALRLYNGTEQNARYFGDPVSVRAAQSFPTLGLQRECQVPAPLSVLDRQRTLAVAS